MTADFIANIEGLVLDKISREMCSDMKVSREKKEEKKPASHTHFCRVCLIFVLSLIVSLLFPQANGLSLNSRTSIYD